MSQEPLQLSDAHKAFDIPRPITNQVDPNRQIPERQVYSSQEKFDWRIGSRSIKITSGFNEPTGHGKKGSMLYLDEKSPDPNKPSVKTPGNYNVGIDFVYAPNDSQNVTPLYSGTVISAKNTGSGYGNQVVVKTNQSYEYNGKRYPIHNVYSHLENIEKNITVGQSVDTDTFLGNMGRSGLSIEYGKHVDLQSYIIVEGKKIQISPNLMQKNLEQQSQRGTFNYSQNINSSSSPAFAMVGIIDNPLSQNDSLKTKMSQEKESLYKSEISSLYLQLYNLAVEASEGNRDRVMGNLIQYGDNGLAAFKQNDPTMKTLSEEQQNVVIENAIKNTVKVPQENVLA